MTSTLDEAREHARRQSGPAPVTVPATAAIDLPAGVDPATVVWDETLGSGGYTSRRIRRDTLLRVSDPEGDACVALVAWSAANTAERLNVADTVKVQWQAYLGPGSLLLSDMGRVLMTLVADTSARHDCLCGVSTVGPASGPTPNGRDLLVLGATKHGLQRRDVPLNVNLFKAVRVAEDGALAFDGEPAPGAFVELRAELDLIVALANVPHPLDDRPYTATAARITAWRADRPDDDPLRESTPERLRAFRNTEELVR
jgi:urea carboxylase-associated protein 2